MRSKLNAEINSLVNQLGRGIVEPFAYVTAWVTTIISWLKSRISGNDF